MVDLDFSLIGERNPALEELLDQFQRDNDIKIYIKQMDWSDAWTELLASAIYDRGPDVSHIGSTWAGSLIGMNALRPFSEAELASFGGQDAFLPQAWVSGGILGQPGYWSLPWSTYTFVLCYRRDLLEKAGIPEFTAFQSAAALAQTLRKLKEAGIEMPWIVPVDPAHVDTLHYVASWVWGAGGDYVSPNGRQILLKQPATQSGLKAYFQQLLYLRPAFSIIPETTAQELFSSGRAAITIVGYDLAMGWLNGTNIAPEISSHLGVSCLPGVPWIGGDNLVIWNRARAFADCERAAVDLVRFLVGKSSQEVLCRAPAIQYPVRLDTLLDPPLPESPATRATIQSLRTGRSYHPIPMWGRIEYQLSEALGQVGQEILAGAEPAMAINRILSPVATRLEIGLRL